MTDNTLNIKTEKLKAFFENNKSVALAFSGGADSAYLLAVAVKYNADIKAYFVKTQFQPEFELSGALDFSNSLNVRTEILNIDILKHDFVCENDENRCYFCKRIMFEAIIKKAREDGYFTVIEGTNASDDITDRPGFKAISELSVSSPLKACGITKRDVRMLLKSENISLWDKPSYSCLATRIKTDEKIDNDKLTAVEKAEGFLFSLGFSDFRIRKFHNTAVIQLKKQQFELLLSKSDIITAGLKPYFDNIFLDLKER